MQDARLIIQDGALIAEGFDNTLGFSQSISRHVWEQMVLDLVVQPAIPEIDQRMSLDIAGGKYLLMQEVHWTILVQDEHSFMVGGKDRTKVEAIEHVMDDHKQNYLPDVQPKEQQAKVEHVVEDHEEYLSEGMLDLSLEQELDAPDRLKKCDEQQQREEEVRLVFHHEPQKILSALSYFFSKSNKWHVDVRITIELIRMPVMLIVPINPPAITYAQQ